MIAETMVSRFLFRAACIPHPCTNNSINTPELGVRPPESTQGKGGRLNELWSLGIYSRNASILCAQIVYYKHIVPPYLLIHRLAKEV